MTAARKAPPKRGRGGGSTSGAGDDTDAQLALREEFGEELVFAPPPAPEVEPSGLKNVGFLGKAWRDFRGTLKEAAQWKSLSKTPYGVVPLLVFAFQGIVFGFDGTIFSVILPDVVRDLNISVSTILTALNLVSFAFIFISIAIARFLDRSRRIPFVAAGTILNGLTSLLTPHTRRAVTLGATRLMDSVGTTTALIPESGLLLDYYPVHERGKAIAFVTTITRAGTLFAPWAVGLLVINYNWRTPFYITGPLLIVAGLLMAIFLREPIRGYMERRAAGLSEAESRQAEPPVSFGQAWRTIWGTRTLQRLFIADAIGGVGSRIYSFIFVFFLLQEYGLDALERGKLSTLIGVFSLIGGFVGGGVVDSLMRRRPQRVLIFSGVLSMLAAVAIGTEASVPPLWILVVLTAIFGFTSALLGPARFVLFGQLIPANIRTQGGTVFALAAIPSAIVFQSFIGRIPSWGFTGLILASAPFLFLAALVDISASGLFERDMRNAMASQTATAAYKRAKDGGKLKMLVCRDVDVEYSGVQVLFNVDFEVEEGEIVALLGTNGAGKSTLLRAISGIREASGGAVVFDGRDITHVPPYEIVGRGVVHMPGGRGIFPGLSVRENLALGTWIGPEDEPRKNYVDPEHLKDVDLDEVLRIFPALTARMDAKAGALSGGEQQMLSLAQAFLQRPKLLLIDELSLGLSPAIVEQLLEAVKEINKRGVTIVVVEQSVNVALTIAERAVFMEKGEVRFVGKSKDLLARPDILRAVYVKGTGALTSQPGGSRRQRRPEDKRAVLDVEGLTKSFGGVRAVDDVSFTLHDEEILGLIGPNGAGKTTIFDLISGYQMPDAGKVIFEGADITSMPPDQRARQQLIRRFQDAKLFPSLTVYETILLALDRRQDVKNMALIAMQIPQARQSERRVRRRADQLIDLLGIGAYRDKFVKELSTGLRRVCDIACVLATDPRVLLLDEPSSGIAQAEAESLGPLLARVRRETGCSILIIEHDMPLISRVADELVALEQGRVIMRDVPDVVLNDPRVVESYLGTSEAAIRRSGR
jgi:branched-chain amino acid transport system ATP-binding protein